MLIKYYSTDASLIIIDGVEDIHVPANPVFGDYALEPWQVFCFDEEKTSDTRPAKVITYAKNGPCMLKVYNFAYICNDQGKTIEKVEGGRA